MATSKCETYNRPVLKGIDTATHTILLYQPRCKMWACPYCAVMNSHYWTATIAEGVRRYWEQGENEWTFITLTSHPKLRTKRQCLHVWPSAWGKFSRNMRHHYQSPRYTLMPELHRNGRLHTHLIVSSIISKRWLKTYAPKSGLGYQVDAQRISNPAGSVCYVTKYLSKSAKHAQWPDGFRRIRTSQYWPKLQEQTLPDVLDIEWTYLTTYPSDGLDYLAQGIKESTGLDVKVL